MNVYKQYDHIQTIEKTNIKLMQTIHRFSMSNQDKVSFGSTASGMTPGGGDLDEDDDANMQNRNTNINRGGSGGGGSGADLSSYDSAQVCKINIKFVWNFYKICTKFL